MGRDNHRRIATPSYQACLRIPETERNHPTRFRAFRCIEDPELYRQRTEWRYTPELGNLANLEFLDIGVNRLTGSIPEELGHLAKLEFFDVGQNLLTGSIPPQLGNLLRLRSFIVGANSLTGEFPRALGQLAFLHTLAIDRNMLSGCVPASLNVETARIGDLRFCDN